MYMGPSSKDIPRICFCFRIKKLSRALNRLYDNGFRRLGLKSTQFNLLAALFSNGALPMGALADGVGLERTTLSRNIKPLLSKGWVDLLPGEDPRVRMVTLTPKGKKVFESAIPLWRDSQEKAKSLLSKGLGDFYPGVSHT